MEFVQSETRSKLLGRADVIGICTILDNGMVTKAIESWSTPMFQVRCTFRMNMPGGVDKIPTGLAFDPNATPDMPLEEHVCTMDSPDEIVVTDTEGKWCVVRKLSAEQLRTLQIPCNLNNWEVPEDYFPDGHRTKQLTLGDKDMIMAKIVDWCKILDETGKPPEMVN